MRGSLFPSQLGMSFRLRLNR
uniref:Uncharacterized protein n=1 Tax=Anguilla anguilla TaxID=7936 RepID=A0A0E9TBJ9_ANGAN